MTGKLARPGRVSLQAALTLAVVVTAFVGCQAAATNTPGSGSQGAAGFGGSSGNFAGASGAAGLDGTNAAGTGALAGTGGGASSTGGAGGGVVVGRDTSGTTPLPCDVAAVLKNSCQSCHAASPISGVPMALVSWEDTQQPSVTNPAVTVHDMMKMRLHDKVRPMPQTGMLAADQLAILDTWLDAGAKAGTDPSCKPPADPMMYGGVMPPDVENCYEIHVHQNSAPGDTAPLMVDGEHYGTFYFDAPWPDTAQAVYFETLPGENPKILHHWLLYVEENSNNPDGTVSYPTSGSHPSSPTLVAGWAPGSNNNDIPSNVGLMLSGSHKKMSLEFHFFNQTGLVLPTTAGVKICTVEKHLRENTASVSWLGTELGINIPPMAADSTATGTCTPQNQTGDIHVVRSWPHMHLTGRKMEVTILRADGSMESVSPPGGWPFDFNSEVSYSTPYVLHPGDKVQTVCHYTNPNAYAIQVGFENRYEMCFNFTLAYPAKALVNKGVFGSTSLTNSSTACEY